MVWTCLNRAAHSLIVQSSETEKESRAEGACLTDYQSAQRVALPATSDHQVRKSYPERRLISAAARWSTTWPVVSPNGLGAQRMPAEGQGAIRPGREGPDD